MATAIMKKTWGHSVRDLFKSMTFKVSASDYEPNRKRYTCRIQVNFNEEVFHSVAEGVMFSMTIAMPTNAMLATAMLCQGKNPMEILTSQVRTTTPRYVSCFRKVREFTLQPTDDSEVILSYDGGALNDTCS
jgi:hypothetical protein